MTMKNRCPEPDPWFANNAKARALVDAVKRGPMSYLFRDPNIRGMAFGRREAHGERTDTPALVVYVAKKMPARMLPPSRLIPRRMMFGGDCVEIDIVETGFLYPLAFTARLRPAPSGVSIGNATALSSGTLGCLVIDNTDGRLCILSNNHVLALSNAATLGDNIIQPGAFDGGMPTADAIATLRRFVMLNPTGNMVDGAIAVVNDPSLVIDRMMNDLTPVANADHPAVGLLFAGSCNRTLMNPISVVLNQLNISFPGGATGGPPPIADATIGMNVEKVGRTTEYTTSTIKEIDVTVTITYPTGNATFDNQIATGWMSDRGDSGSLVYAGGDGSDIEKCGCGAAAEAGVTLQREVKTETAFARELRDKYLRHTKIGRWAIELFYINEEQLLERFRVTDILQDDVSLARKLYDTYVEQARMVAAAPESSDRTITANHMREAEQAFKRARCYLTRQEAEAGEKLLALARERLIGKNPREVLAMLQDEQLLMQLQALVAEVPTIRSKDSC